MFSKRPLQSPPTSGGGAITCRRRRRGGSSDSDEAPAHRRVRTGVDEEAAARLDVPPLADMRTSGWKLKDDAADDVSQLRRVIREELCHCLPPVLREELSHCLVPLLREELSHRLPPFLSKLESILDSKLESRQESIDQRFEDFNHKVDQRTHLQPSHCNQQNPLHEANNEGANAEGLMTNEGEAKSTSFRLRFLDEMKPPIYHDDAIKAESNKAIRIGIFNGDQMIKSGALSKVKLEILALEGDFPYGTKDSWTSEEFNKHIACGRDGRGTVLAGECTVDLTNGEACLGTIKFREGSCRARCGKFILAARVWVTARTGEHVQEAVMKPEVVLDRRNKSNGKSHPPKLDDNVHCLEQIANDGTYCKRLNEKGIVTVADLLKALNKDPDNLANILQMKKECKAWDKMVAHARECTLEDKRELKSYRDTRAKVVLYFNFVNIFVGAKFDGNYIASGKLDSYQQGVVAKLKEKAYQLLDDLPFDHTLEGDLPLQNHIDTNASGHHAADQVQGTGQAGQEQLSVDGSHIPATDQLNNNDDNQVNIPKDCPNAKSVCISSQYVMENNVRHPVSTTSATAAGLLNHSDHEIPYQAENLRNVGGTVHPNVFNASNPNDVSIDDNQGPNFTDQATTLLPDRQQNFQGPMYSPEGSFYSMTDSMIAGIQDSFSSIQHQDPPVLKSRPHGTELLLMAQQPHAPQGQDPSEHPFSIPNASNFVQHQVPQLLESRPLDTALMLAVHQSSNYVQHQDPQPLESRPYQAENLRNVGGTVHPNVFNASNPNDVSIDDYQGPNFTDQATTLLPDRQQNFQGPMYSPEGSFYSMTDSMIAGIQDSFNSIQHQDPPVLKSRPHGTELLLMAQQPHAPQGQDPSEHPFSIPNASNFVQHQVPQLLESRPLDTALMLAVHQPSNYVQHQDPQPLESRPYQAENLRNVGGTVHPNVFNASNPNDVSIDDYQGSNFTDQATTLLPDRQQNFQGPLYSPEGSFHSMTDSVIAGIQDSFSSIQHQVPPVLKSGPHGTELLLMAQQPHAPQGQDPSEHPFSIPNASNFVQHQVPQLRESRSPDTALMLAVHQPSNYVQHQDPQPLESRPPDTSLMPAAQQLHAQHGQEPSGLPFSIPEASNSVQHQISQLLESRSSTPETALMLTTHQTLAWPGQEPSGLPFNPPQMSNYAQQQIPQFIESGPRNTSLMPAAQQLHAQHGQEPSGLSFSIPEASNSVQHQISQLLESRSSTPETTLMLTTHQTLASPGQEPSGLPFNPPQTSNYAQQQIPQFIESGPRNTSLMLAAQQLHASQGREPNSLPFGIPQASNYVQQQVPRLLESRPPDTALMLAAHPSHAPHGQEPSSLPFSILQASNNCVQHPVPQLIENRPPDTALMLATQQPHAPHGQETSGLPFNIPQVSNYAQHQVPQLESRPLGSALMLGTQQAPHYQELSGLPFSISQESSYAQHQVPQPESRSLGSAWMMTTQQLHGPHGQEPSGLPFSMPHVSNYAQHQVPQPESRSLGSELMLTTQQLHGPHGQEPSGLPFSIPQVSNYAQH